MVQPEDKIDPALLIPKIGPYDIFATQWGYTPIPDGQDTPAAEKPVLDRLDRESRTASPGCASPRPRVRASTATPPKPWATPMRCIPPSLGIKNLQRIVKQLPQDGP